MRESQWEGSVERSKFSIAAMSVALLFAVFASHSVYAQTCCNTDVRGPGACPPIPDGQTNFSDVNYLLQCVVRQEDPCGQPLSYCDVNCDGFVNHTDVSDALERFFNPPYDCLGAGGACCGATSGGTPPCAVVSDRYCNTVLLGTLQGIGTTCLQSTCDCNGNLVFDGIDVQSGTSEDCDGNGSPDECDGNACCYDTPSCNGGPNAGFPCASSQNCGGAPCDGPPVPSCALQRKDVCEAPPINGTWLGGCKKCPKQNSAIVIEPGGEVFIHIVGPPVECPDQDSLNVVAQRGGCTGPPYTDAWVSNAGATMCHNFGAAATSPIPADFFNPGSDPFTGNVCLAGVPLGFPEFGDADTLISRSDDPFSRCDPVTATPASVDIEIVALSLASTAPITVTFNGGQNPETWNVAVDISPSGVLPGTPQSSLTATRTSKLGGTYTSTLYVQPRFTFTKVGSPSDVRVLDTFDAGVDPIQLAQSTAAPWSIQVDPSLGAQLDVCSDFHAGIVHTYVAPVPDCNFNLEFDDCDIASGGSLDDNLNGIPDECESPVGVGDDTCYSANVNLGTACSTDADCAGNVCGLKSRYLTVTPPTVAVAGGQPYSIRVKTPTHIFFAGPEQAIPNPPSGDLRGAALQCVPTDVATPNIQVWTSGFLHLFGPAIRPGLPYEISMCDSNGSNCSVPLIVSTGNWGDIIAPFGGSSQPNLGDVNAAVLKFQGNPAAPGTPRADLRGSGSSGAPNIPNQVVDLADANASIQAFQGNPYPYPVPVCP